MEQQLYCVKESMFFSPTDTVEAENLSLKEARRIRDDLNKASDVYSDFYIVEQERANDNYTFLKQVF